MKLPTAGIPMTRHGPSGSDRTSRTNRIGQPIEKTTYAVTQSATARPSRLTHVAIARPRLVIAAP